QIQARQVPPEGAFLYLHSTATVADGPDCAMVTLVFGASAPLQAAFDRAEARAFEFFVDECLRVAAAFVAEHPLAKKWASLKRTLADTRRQAGETAQRGQEALAAARARLQAGEDP